MTRKMIGTRILASIRIMIRKRSLREKGSSRQSPSDFAISMVYVSPRERVAHSAESEGKKCSYLQFEVKAG